MFYGPLVHRITSVTKVSQPLSSEYNLQPLTYNLYAAIWQCDLDNVPIPVAEQFCSYSNSLTYDNVIASLVELKNVGLIDFMSTP